MLGYHDRETACLEFRFSGSDRHAVEAHAKELSELNVEVIVAFAGEAIPAAFRATDKIPIVSAAGDGDFIKMGLAASWENPGRNLTGMNLDFSAAAATRVNILRALVPGLRRLYTLHDPSFLSSAKLVETMAQAVVGHGVEVVPMEFRGDADVEQIVRFAREGVGDAVVTVQGPLLHHHMPGLVRRSLELGLPLAMGEPGAAEAGALLQVNVDVPQAAAESAKYVHRILRGQSPGQLPIERFGQMRRICNTRTAARLNIPVDPAALRQWGEVGFVT